jgi:hypothetical protein
MEAVRSRNPMLYDRFAPSANGLESLSTSTSIIRMARTSRSSLNPRMERSWELAVSPPVQPEVRFLRIHSRSSSAHRAALDGPAAYSGSLLSCESFSRPAGELPQQVYRSDLWPAFFLRCAKEPRRDLAWQEPSPGSPPAELRPPFTQRIAQMTVLSSSSSGIRLR